MCLPTVRPLAAAAIFLCAVGSAQAFPEGAATPPAAQLNQHLSDKVFNAALADGSSMRLDFKSSGYLFVDTSRGRNFKGEWKAEDGRLCSKMQGTDPSCSEVRMHEGLLYLKRAVNGEIVTYQPR